MFFSFLLKNIFKTLCSCKLCFSIEAPSPRGQPPGGLLKALQGFRLWAPSFLHRRSDFKYLHNNKSLQNKWQLCRELGILDDPPGICDFRNQTNRPAVPAMFLSSAKEQTHHSRNSSTTLGKASLRAPVS